MLNIYHSYEEFKKRVITEDTEGKRKSVLEIIEWVKKKGDNALYELTERYDEVILGELKVSETSIKRVLNTVDPGFIVALKQAADNIKSYHEKQKKESWFTTEKDGTILGQKITPMNRVGIYVPGGTAAYPSSVLMNAIPAQVAGVKEIVMVTPPLKSGEVNVNVLLAAEILGIKEIYSVGGAQAVAALAYGTETIKPVDKIVGPGNVYVALAKKEVFGQVGIDMIAGPSEIVIVADEKAKPSYIAADLLSQAEHDVMAASIMITTSSQLAEAVQREVEQQLNVLPRKEIAKASLSGYGGIILAESVEEAINVANKIAPEHLELMVEEPFEWLGRVEHAGAIFLGDNSPEPVGDYFAGPNHVLPTSGTARFSSPLSVDDFVKKSSVISYSKQAILENGGKIIKLAEQEGLQAHAQAIKIRLGGSGGE